MTTSPVDASAPARGGAGSSATPGPVRLEVGPLNDLTFSAVVRLVSAYPPFQGYAFGLMVPRLIEQLTHGANVLAIQGGVLVGYAGWLRVRAPEAAAWQQGERAIPAADWVAGDAAIVTVTVARAPALLPHVVRGISHVCAGLPVYRMRSFQDGRPDARRPPITGRVHRFAAP